MTWIRQCVFYPEFTDAENPTLSKVADHIEYLAKKCGKGHVGIASDFGEQVRTSFRGV